MRADTRVFVAFDLSVSGQGEFFTLNDAVKGELDNTTYVLAGDVLTDVTSDVRSLTLRRGRSWQLDKVQAGEANITLANLERQYDPANALQTDTRNNLVPNPSFEVGTANWSASATDVTSAGATVTTGAAAAFGAAAAQVTTTDVSASQGFHTILSLAASTTYTFSAYVFPLSGERVFFRTKDLTNDVLGSVDVSRGTIGTFDEATLSDWDRLSSSITTGASAANVLLAFGADYAVSRFTLDDPTLGELGNISAPLAGLTDSVFYVDAVLGEASASVGPYFDGGVADGTILAASVAWDGAENNSTSTLGFGIPGTGSPYFPSVKPRKEIQVTIDGDSAFTGVVEDWDYQYSPGGDATATVRGADGFTRLAQSIVNPVAVPGESTGSRIERILDLDVVGWPAGLRDIDTGAATLASGSTGTDTVNALEYLQRVEAAEPGTLFINGAGVLTFRSRTASQNLTGVVFGDATGVPFTNVSIDYGTDNVRNTVIVSREGGALVTATDTVSVDEYGPISYEITDSLLADDDQVATLAEYIVGLYGQPKIRIDTITVDVGALSLSQRSEVLGLDLGDVVRVLWTPQGVGTPLDRYLSVDSIEHSITARDHYVTFDMSDASPGFILDSSVFGVLNSSKLGF